MLFDWLVVGHVLANNPAHAVRGPKYSQRNRASPVLDRDEARVIPANAAAHRDHRPCRRLGDAGRGASRNRDVKSAVCPASRQTKIIDPCRRSAAEAGVLRTSREDARNIWPSPWQSLITS